MAVAWTDITNAQVASGAALTTALITSLRDNPEGIAQRATGAPKIFGNAYDYQEFIANGTWTKPASAETGDRVIVHVVGGGGAGARATGSVKGGGGGAGVLHHWRDIDDLPATVAVTVGAGVAGNSGSPTTKAGSSTFGTSNVSDEIDTFEYIECEGGDSGGDITPVVAGTRYYNDQFPISFEVYIGGLGGADGSTTGGGSIFGGGGGGGADSNETSGGISAWAGKGGRGIGSGGTAGSAFIDGEFPGGGGGGVNTGATGDTVGGSGADGYVQVWCLREDA